ncbi:hypothetical protein NXS19_001317 [Fusarium pseudograminearum]|nr:hypothetical protein NXS19_001317 [Fusarium pseudograminearum]
MRGRELRATAALARFEKQKVEPDPVKDDEETDSGSGSEFEDEPGEDSKDAIGVDGKKILDGQGRGMVRVCGDEDVDDLGAIDETQELQRMIRGIKGESPGPQVSDVPKNTQPQGQKKQSQSSATPTTKIKSESSKSLNNPR